MYQEVEDIDKLKLVVNDFLEDLEVTDQQVVDRIMRSNLKELIERVGT